MTTPESLKGKTVGEIRQMARGAAQAALEMYWDDRTIPVDPVHIARSFGASVFLAQLGDDVTGMVVGDPAGANIYVDKESAPVRQRFTVAHEIGHMVSHESELVSPEVQFIDARSDNARGTASEIYANEFAAELLMPRQQVEEAIARGIDGFELAAYFGVSIQAMAYRRQLLGLKA